MHIVENAVGVRGVADYVGAVVLWEACEIRIVASEVCASLKGGRPSPRTPLSRERAGAGKLEKI
jgi:hypothetical protein